MSAWLGRTRGTPGWQRDLAVSHDKVGEVLQAEGNLPAAQRSYESALAIRERLAKQDPGNADWQRDLAFGHDRVGEVLRFAGKFPEAQRSFESAAGHPAERLTRQDPKNAEWQADLATSYDKVGNMQRHEAKLVEARRSYEARPGHSRSPGPAGPGERRLAETPGIQPGDGGGDAARGVEAAGSAAIS